MTVIPTTTNYKTNCIHEKRLYLLLGKYIYSCYTVFIYFLLWSATNKHNIYCQNVKQQQHLSAFGFSINGLIVIKPSFSV